MKFILADQDLILQSGDTSLPVITTILENEEIIAAAFNDLNTRMEEGVNITTTPSAVREKLNGNIVKEVLIPIDHDNIIDDISGSSNTVVREYANGNDKFLTLLSSGCVIENATLINASLIGDGVCDNAAIMYDSTESSPIYKIFTLLPLDTTFDKIAYLRVKFS